MDYRIAESILRFLTSRNHGMKYLHDMIELESSIRTYPWWANNWKLFQWNQNKLNETCIECWDYQKLHKLSITNITQKKRRKSYMIMQVELEENPNRTESRFNKEEVTYSLNCVCWLRFPQALVWCLFEKACKAVSPIYQSTLKHFWHKTK